MQWRLLLWIGCNLRNNLGCSRFSPRCCRYGTSHKPHPKNQTKNNNKKWVNGEQVCISGFCFLILLFPMTPKQPPFSDSFRILRLYRRQSTGCVEMRSPEASALSCLGTQNSFDVAIVKPGWAWVLNSEKTPFEKSGKTSSEFSFIISKLLFKKEHLI